MNKSIKSIVLFAIVSLGIVYSANAQIKVVGEDYGTELTGSKNYYGRDVNFDKLFRQMTPRKHHGAMMAYPSKYDLTYSMLGDTVYVYKTIPSSGILATGSSIPQGYYEITGYIFCKENADSILSSYGLTHDHIYSYNEKTIKSLKQDLLKDNFNSLSDYMMYIVLTQIDSKGEEPIRVFLNAYKLPEYYRYNNSDKVPTFDAYDYPEALDYPEYGWHNFIYLRYYNEIKEQFLGKEVYLAHQSGNGATHRMLIDKCDANYESYRCNDAIGFDNIKNEQLKLLDKKYVVKDVILHQGRVCCVLQGEQTGTFAVYTAIIGYAYTTFDISSYPEGFTKLYRESTYPAYDVPFILTTQRYPNFIEGFKIVRVADWQKMKQREQQKLKAKKRQETANKIATKSAFITKYGAKFGELVANKQAALDMTKEMVKDAWGRPMNTYRTTTKFGQSEVWCYNYKTRIYFYDGKVVMIDD